MVDTVEKENTGEGKFKSKAQFIMALVRVVDEFLHGARADDSDGTTTIQGKEPSSK